MLVEEDNDKRTIISLREIGDGKIPVKELEDNAIKRLRKEPDEIEKQVKEFIYSGIEWRPHNYIKLNKAENEKITELLETLDDDDDIQNVFFNCKIEKV